MATVPPTSVPNQGPAAPASVPFVPVSDEEWAARQDWLTQALDEIDAEDDDPIDAFDQLQDNLDSQRLRDGRPPAFGETA